MPVRGPCPLVVDVLAGRDAGQDACRVDPGDQAARGGDGLVEGGQERVRVPQRPYGHVGRVAVLVPPGQRLPPPRRGAASSAPPSGAGPCGTSASVVRDSSFRPRSAPRKSATKSSAGRARSSAGRRALDEVAAGAEDGYAVAEPYGLVDVVRDEDDGLVQLPLEAQEFVLELGADHGVDRAERLVHEQHRRVRGERAGHADALLLAAGELVRVALAGVGGEADRLQELGRPRPRLPAAPAEQQRHGGDVVEDRAVREEPGLLDDVADGAAQLGRVLLAGRPCR